MNMNLIITKNIHRNGVVMNPTMLPARKRKMPFAIPDSHYFNIII
jgi:hypothetical protein